MPVNDYLKMKWSVGFLANDIDGNGYITMEDAEMFLDKFIQLHNLQGDTARKVRKDFNTVWKQLFRMDRDTDRVDEATFLHKLTTEYNTDKDAFCNRVKKYVSDLCDIYDVNHDGKLSEEEYVVTLKCHGVESLDRTFIQTFTPKEPGYVDLQTYKASWVEYFTNDDKEKNEIERPCLIGFNIIERN